MQHLYFLILLNSFLTLPAYSQVDQIQIYKNGKLTTNFLQALCDAAVDPVHRGGTGASYLEKLINTAAGTYHLDSLQPVATKNWHSKFASELRCPAYNDFPESNFLRLIVETNYRDIANLIGPKNRLSLDLTHRDTKDSLTIFDYINRRRIQLEKKHNDRRFEFQQDQEWKNIMFFYFLFSEYNIN